MYVGLLSGGGVFGKHYTNIYGYQKWIGYDSNGNHHEKYLLEARINDGNSTAWYCDDNILDTGMMGIIYYDINYNHTDYFSAVDFSSFVNDNGRDSIFTTTKTQPLLQVMDTLLRQVDKDAVISKISILFYHQTEVV